MTLLVGAALAGCTASQPGTSVSPAISTAAWPTAQLFHTGRASVLLTVPAGARSLHVDFSCTSGLYSVGPEVDLPRDGMCGGAQRLDFDIHSIAPDTRLTIELIVPDATRFAATMNFSTSAFTPDPVTAEECHALSRIQDAYVNADQGHDHGDVSDLQWTQLTASAKTDVAALAAQTKKNPSSAGLLGTVVPSLAEWLTGTGDHPGGVMHAPPGDFTVAETLAGQICSSNGTSIVIHSKYGG
ncbi:hypothetical protein ACFRFH_15000 [Leifsonia sp. NPDC056824]|uniref:hypothetical protein n=1 Tax=Leifsonia sp. NPDC056824 TaxID=3345953 RepID=UPI00368E7581